MAPVALLVIGGIRAGSEDGFSLEHPFSIMTGAAMETFAVRLRTDARGLRLHGKADIDMADPARKLGPVKPVIKYDGTGSRRGVIVKNHLAILRRFRWRFWQIDLGGRDISQKES